MCIACGKKWEGGPAIACAITMDWGSYGAGDRCLVRGRVRVIR